MNMNTLGTENWIYNNKQIGRQYFYMRDGFLVRCVRD